MNLIRFLLYGIIWLVTAIIELSLLFAGLISQGHDRAKLIIIALVIVCLPALAYGLHRLVAIIFADKPPSMKP